MYPGSFDKINIVRYVKNHYISDFLRLKMYSVPPLTKSTKPVGHSTSPRGLNESKSTAEGPPVSGKSRGLFDRWFEP